MSKIKIEPEEAHRVTSTGIKHRKRGEGIEKYRERERERAEENQVNNWHKCTVFSPLSRSPFLVHSFTQE